MTEINKRNLKYTFSKIPNRSKNSRRICRVAVLMVALIILITTAPGCSGQERAGSTDANAGIQSESDTAVAASGNVTADRTGRWIAGIRECFRRVGDRFAGIGTDASAKFPLDGD